MPKLWNFDPSDEFAVKLHYVLAVNPPFLPDQQTGRARRRVKKLSRRKPKTQLYRFLEAACQELADRLNKPRHQVETLRFIDRQVRNLKAGYYDPEYWAEAAHLWTVALSCEPTNVPDPTPPPYSYRDPTNLPSDVTYPDGETAEIVPTVTGETTAGYFHDTLWSWRKTLIKLAAPVTVDVFEPLILELTGDIHVLADVRPSRPMFSVVARVYLGDANNPENSTLRPPLTRTISWAWRYKPPRSNDLPYSITVSRRCVGIVNGRADYQDLPQWTHMLTTYAGAPLKGRRFNNNTAVAITADLAPVLHQIKPKPKPAQAILESTPNAVVHTYVRATATWTAHQQPQGTALRAVRNDRYATYVAPRSFFVQDSLFQYVGQWTRPNELTEAVNSLQASPTGFNVYTTNFTEPRSRNTYRYTPDGIFIDRRTTNLYAYPTYPQPWNQQTYVRNYIAGPGQTSGDVALHWFDQDGAYLISDWWGPYNAYGYYPTSLGLYIWLFDQGYVHVPWPSNLTPHPWQTYRPSLLRIPGALGTWFPFGACEDGLIVRNAQNLYRVLAPNGTLTPEPRPIPLYATHPTPFNLDLDTIG